MPSPSLRINALSNWASLVVNVIIGFLLTPFIIRSFGKTGYGIFVLVCSFIGYYGLLNLGVGSAITRYIARYSAQKDRERLSEVASTALAMFSVTGTLAIVLSFMLANVVADFFNVEPSERTDFIRLIRIIGLVTGVSFPGSVLGAIITAREHYVAKNVVVIFQELLRAGLTVLFVIMGWGLVGLGLAPLIAAILGFTCNLVLFRMFAADIQLRPAYVNRKTLGMLLVYGGVTTIISIADIMRVNLDSLVIGKWIGVDAIGVYGVAALILRGISRVVTSAMRVIAPRFAALDGRGDREQMQRLLVKALSFSSFLSFGGCMIAIVFGKQFVLWWVGEDFTEAVAILWILSISSAFALAQNPSIGFMYALYKHHFYAIATIIEAVANLTLSIILVYRYGIVGVALGTMISMLIVKIMVMPVYVAKIAGIGVWQYVRPMMPPAIVASIMILAVYNIDIVKQDTTSIGYLICGGVIAGALYVAACYLVMRKSNVYPSVIPGSEAPR